MVDCSEIPGMTEQMRMAKISISSFLPPLSLSHLHLLRSVHGFQPSLPRSQLLQLSHTMCIFPLLCVSLTLFSHPLSGSLTFSIHCHFSQSFPESFFVPLRLPTSHPLISLAFLAFLFFFFDHKLFIMYYNPVSML